MQLKWMSFIDSCSVVDESPFIQALWVISLSPFRFLQKFAVSMSSLVLLPTLALLLDGLPTLTDSLQKTFAILVHL